MKNFIAAVAFGLIGFLMSGGIMCGHIVKTPNGNDLELYITTGRLMAASWIGLIVFILTSAIILCDTRRAA